MIEENNMKKPDLHNTTSRHEVFKAPKGYFAELDKRIMLNVAQAQKADNTSEAKQTVVAADEPQTVVTINGADTMCNESKKSVRKVPFWKTELYAKVKPYIYMAAMFGGLYFGVWVYKYQQKLINEKAVASMQATTTDNGSSTQEETEDYVNEACDYMMTDSHDIMACVTDVEQ